MSVRSEVEKDAARRYYISKVKGHKALVIHLPWNDPVEQVDSVAFLMRVIASRFGTNTRNAQEVRRGEKP